MADDPVSGVTTTTTCAPVGVSEVTEAREAASELSKLDGGGARDAGFFYDFFFFYFSEGYDDIADGYGRIFFISWVSKFLRNADDNCSS